MVEIQVFAVEDLAAVLAGVFVPLEDIVPRKLDLLLGQMVVNDQQDYAGHPDPE